MPYSMPDNIPDYIKGLPEGAQRIFVDVFNSTLDGGASEEEARMAGWGAVKNAYEEKESEWVRKARDMTMRYVSSLGTIPPGEGGATSVVQVFRTGTFRHPLYGKFTITDDTLKAMEDNFKASRPKPPTEMVVDYEHMSAIGPPAVTPAAGWVKSVEAVEGTLMATVEWTEKATDLIRAKEYRFISPEWNMNYKDKETGKDIGPCLLTVALTNRPFIEGMQPVMLSDKLEEANAAVLVLSETTLGRLVAADMEPKELALNKAAEIAGVEETNEHGEDKSNLGQEDTALEEKIRELLGLTPEDDLVEAIKALKTKADAAGQVEADKEEAVQAKDRAEASLTAANAKLTAADVNKDVNQALADGHILPKQVDWAKNLRAKDAEGFRSFLATAPKIGPTGAILGVESSDDAIQLTEAEVKIGKMLGVSKEDLVAQKQRDAAAKA